MEVCGVVDLLAIRGRVMDMEKCGVGVWQLRWW